MAAQGSSLVSLLILAIFLSVNVLSAGSAAPSNITNALKRSSFPPRFIFGAASSAYQVHKFLWIVHKLHLTWA